MSTALPPAIEIFRPGRHADDAGVVHEFTPADVSGMAAAYDPVKREAPLTVGHPEHDRPAYGWVGGLGVSQSGALVMDTRQVEPAFAEMVAKGRFKKRSASFYPPSHPNNPTPDRWYLRHVAFLGAQPPAIAGLKDFSEADAVGAVSFSESTEPPPDPEERSMSDPSITPEQLAAAQAAATDAETRAQAAEAKLAQFAEAQRGERHNGHVSFCEQQIAAGRLLPKDKPAAVAVLDTLADAAPVNFSEGGAQKTLSGAEWLKSLIASFRPVVQFGEYAPVRMDQTASGQPLTDAELDAKARIHAAQHKVSYAEALAAVVAFTQTA